MSLPFFPLYKVILHIMYVYVSFLCIYVCVCMCVRVCVRVCSPAAVVSLAYEQVWSGGTLVANVTEQRPELIVNQLSPNTPYRLLLYAITPDARSTPLLLHARTPRRPPNHATGTVWPLVCVCWCFLFVFCLCFRVSTIRYVGFFRIFSLSSVSLSAFFF